MCTVQAFLEGDRSLGVLRAASGWGTTEHDRYTRKAAYQHKAEHPEQYPLGSDYIQQFLRSRTQDAVDEAKASPTTKVRRSATQVAGLAHRTGLPVPDPEQAEEPEQRQDTPRLLPMQLDRPKPWLAQPMRRKAAY